MADAVVKQGWLLKEGGGAITKWQRRWFVLRGTAIFYGKTQDDANWLGTIYVEDIVGAGPCADKPQKNCIVVSCTNRDYYLSCDTKEEADDWVACISRAAQKIDSHSSEAKVQFVTVEAFANRGLRVSGPVSAALLATLSAGIPPERKRRDERGWWCDRHLPACTVINTFLQHGFMLLSVFPSETHGPLDATLVVANVMVFSRHPTYVPRRTMPYGHRPLSLAHGVGGRPPPKPDKPAMPGGFKLPAMQGNIQLRQVAGSPAKGSPAPSASEVARAEAPKVVAASPNKISLGDIVDDEMQRLMKEFSIPAELL